MSEEKFPKPSEELIGEERQKFLTTLTNQISRITPDHCRVMSIHAKWGSGKSLFMDHLAYNLQDKDKAKVIRFNAWESDFHDDVLTSFVYEIIDAFSNKTEKISLRDETVNLLHLSFNILTAPMKYIEECEPDFDSPKNPKSKFFDQYKNRKNAINGIRNTVSEIAEKLAEEGKPLVFLIDELDRCKPDQAIRVLEIVKHLFEIDNCVFVFAINRKQLDKSVEKMYGTVENEDYLRRFFEFEKQLPNLKYEDFIKQELVNYGQSLNDDLKNGILKHFTECQEEDHKKITPRILKRICKTVIDVYKEAGISSRTSPDSPAYDADIIIQMACLKVMAPNIFSKYASRKLTPKETENPSQAYHSWAIDLRQQIPEHLIFLNENSQHFLKKHFEISQPFDFHGMVRETAAISFNGRPSPIDILENLYVAPVDDQPPSTP